jgi:hypothetical protein
MAVVVSSWLSSGDSSLARRVLGEERPEELLHRGAE